MEIRELVVVTHSERMIRKQLTRSLWNIWTPRYNLKVLTSMRTFFFYLHFFVVADECCDLMTTLKQLMNWMCPY